MIGPEIAFVGDDRIEGVNLMHEFGVEDCFLLVQGDGLGFFCASCGDDQGCECREDFY